MSETFLDPQPFNVAIEPEADVTPHVPMPLLGGAVPNVLQVLSPDVDIYPPRGRGVRPQGVVRAAPMTRNQR